MGRWDTITRQDLAPIVLLYLEIPGSMQLILRNVSSLLYSLFLLCITTFLFHFCQRIAFRIDRGSSMPGQ
jgi:hypothetical protein